MILTTPARPAMAAYRKPYRLGLWDGVISDGIDAVRDTFLKLRNAMRNQRQAAKDRHHLAHSSEYLLRDIGVSRDEVAYGVEKSHWY